MVTYHKQIKECLHPQIFALAANGLTRNRDSVNPDEDALVNSGLTRVKWAERHLRAIIAAIPAEDNASY